MALPHLLLALLSAAPPSLEPRLAEARTNLFDHGSAREAAQLADAVLAEHPDSAPALELSYVAHWMLDDEALGNQRFLDLAAKGGPAAGVFLLEGWGRLRTSEDEGKRLAEVARKLTPNLGALRGAVADVWARTALMSGDLLAVHAAEDPLGWLLKWQLIGPFENDQNSGYDVAYPPERTVDLQASYPGKQAQVSWREVPGGDLRGRICIGCLLHPSSWGVAYLVTWVHSDADRDAVIRAEADDHLKVWVNGRQAIADDTARSAAAEQHLAAVHLHTGWNQLLAKVAQRTGEWNLALRLTDAAGAPLPGLTSSASPQPFRSVRGDKGEQWPAAPVDPTLALLEGQTDPGDGASLAIPARYLEAWRLYDEGYYRKARAMFDKLRAGAPQAAVYAFGAASSALLDEDRDHGLSGLAEASRLDPSFLRAKTERGETYLTMGLQERAEEQAKAALEQNPADPRALDELARLRAARGYWVAAEELLAKQEAAHPHLAVTAYRQAQAAQAQGDPRRALNLFRAAHGRDRDGWEALQGIIELQESLGYPDRARASLEERRSTRPQDVSDLDRLARLEAAYHRDLEAKRWIAEAEKLCPQWDAPYRIAGYLAERSAESAEGKSVEADRAEALAAYREALARDPSDATLRDHVELLSPDSQLAEKYDVSHEEILARAKAAKPEDYPGANGVVLLSQELVRLNADGSSRKWVHFAAKVFDQVGADRYLNRHVGEPSNFKLLYAGTIDPDGLERESSSRDGAILHLPAPSPGSVVELRYSYDEPRASATQDDYWGYFSFGNSDPTLEERWVVLVPKGRPLHVEKRGAGIVEHEEVAGDDTVYTFSEGHLARLETEPSAPPWIDVQDSVFASTLPGWERVAAFVHAVVDDQVIDDETVKQKARELAAGKTTVEEKVAALARFVAKEIRYNQADTSVYTWRPHPAGRVLASRYGDCKDKATLFIALARQLGLHAEFAALRTRQAGSLKVSVPVTWYNHAIAYLPVQKGVAEGRFIDLTADDLGSTYLPFPDQGEEAMVINPGHPGFRFVTTPYSPETDDETRTRSVVLLQPDGSARAEVEISAEGLAAMSFRGAYRNPTSRRRLLDFLAGRWLFEGGVPQKEMSSIHGLDDLDGPVKLDMGVVAPEELRRSGDALLLKPGGFPQSEIYSSQATRKLPMVLGSKILQSVDWEYQLPAGVTVAQLPTDLHLDNRFFAFDVKYKGEAGKILLESRYRTKIAEVAPADYEELRAAMLEVARAGEREIVLHGAPQVPAGK